MYITFKYSGVILFLNNNTYVLDILRTKIICNCYFESVFPFKGEMWSVDPYAPRVGSTVAVP